MMPALAGAITTAVGLFLFLWYRTVAGLAQKRRPQFAARAVFKWGVPALSAAVFAAGLLLLAGAGMTAFFAALVLSLAAGTALIRFDRYSAAMKIILSRYRAIREQPGMSDGEALFLTARWRYPEWSDDRLVELIAGKDIENVILLIVIQENEVHPISDWALYRSLRDKAARIVRPRR
jgi:hypothetical protein